MSFISTRSRRNFLLRLYQRGVPVGHGAHRGLRAGEVHFPAASEERAADSASDERQGGSAGSPELPDHRPGLLQLLYFWAIAEMHQSQWLLQVWGES